MLKISVAMQLNKKDNNNNNNNNNNNDNKKRTDISNETLIGRFSIFQITDGQLISFLYKSKLNFSEP